MLKPAKNLWKLKSVLLGICLSSLGCSSLPQSPEIYQCGFKYVEPVEQSFFACASTKDPNKNEFRELSDPRMQGAQATSIDDFKKFTGYIDELKKRLLDAVNGVLSEINVK